MRFTTFLNSFFVGLAFLGVMPGYSHADSGQFRAQNQEEVFSEGGDIDDSLAGVPFLSEEPVSEYPAPLDWHWADSLELFLGLDGSKQPQDFGVNAHFGGRAHVNWAAPVWADAGIGLQIGTAIAQADHAVAVTKAIEGSSSRTQSFTTVGVFQRSENGWSWGLVHDFLFENDYDSQMLSQWRGRFGFDLTPQDEFGFMGTLPQQTSDAQWAGITVHLKPLAQGNLFWRHTWAFGGQTTGWLGMADRHGRANVALGDKPVTDPVIAFGSDFQVPLNDYWALFGEANFVSPADTGTVDAYLGFAFYPSGGAMLWRRRQFSPVLPVAGSPSFVTNLTR